MDILDFDFVVVGSGIAGLMSAIHLARYGRVGILTKKDSAESNSNYAQGGIACVVTADDSFEEHVRDTLIAGDGLCNESVVRTIISAGPARIAELESFGLKLPNCPVPPARVMTWDVREGIRADGSCIAAISPAGKSSRSCSIVSARNKPPPSWNIALSLISSRPVGWARTGPAGAWEGIFLIPRRARSQPFVRRSPCWPRAVAARCICIPPIPISPPATAWPWPGARVPR